MLVTLTIILGVSLLINGYLTVRMLDYKSLLMRARVALEIADQLLKVKPSKKSSDEPEKMVISSDDMSLTEFQEIMEKSTGPDHMKQLIEDKIKENKAKKNNFKELEPRDPREKQEGDRVKIVDFSANKNKITGESLTIMSDINKIKTLSDKEGIIIKTNCNEEFISMFDTKYKLDVLVAYDNGEEYYVNSSLIVRTDNCEK